VRFIIKRHGNSNFRGLQVRGLYAAVFLEPMPDQSSTFRRTIRGAGGIFLWTLVSIANGAFVAAFIIGVFSALPSNGPGLWLKITGVPVATSTFIALLWWRRSDGSLLWPIVSIAIGPLVAAFLPAATSPRFAGVSIIVIMVLPVATGMFAGWRWWRRGGD